MEATVNTRVQTKNRGVVTISVGPEGIALLRLLKHHNAELRIETLDRGKSRVVIALSDMDLEHKNLAALNVVDAELPADPENPTSFGANCRGL